MRCSARKVFPGRLAPFPHVACVGRARLSLRENTEKRMFARREVK